MTEFEKGVKKLNERVRKRPAKPRHYVTKDGVERYETGGCDMSIGKGWALIVCHGHRMGFIDPKPSRRKKAAQRKARPTRG